MSTEAKDENESPIRRIMVVGASGYLGSALALGLCKDFEVLGTYYRHPVRIEGVTCMPLNCNNGGEIIDCLRRYAPEAVIYCGGVSDAQTCELSPNLAESLHFKAPTVFFKILPLVLRFVFVSPDEALGRPLLSEPPFNETTPSEPQSALSKSRHQGEVLTVGHHKYTAVMRTGQVFGETLGQRAFGASHSLSPQHWIEQLQLQAAAGRRIPLLKNHVRSYLYVGDFVRAVRKYLEKPPIESVLYHLAPTNSISQYEFGKKLCAELGYDAELVQAQANALPLDLSLNSARFTKDYDFKFQSVEEGISEFAARLRAGHTRDWT